MALRGLLDSHAAAECLGVSVGALRKLMSARAVPFVRLSARRMRFKPADLESYIEQHRIASVSERRRGNG